MNELNKKCTKCGEVKPATMEYFTKCNRSKSGLYSSCKECRRKYRIDNKDAILIKAIYHRSIQNKDDVANYRKNYYKKNKVREKARQKEYRTKRKISVYEKQKAWRDDQVLNLKDCYIRDLLLKKAFKNKVNRSDIPTWMIQDKRMELMYHRATKALKEGKEIPQIIIDSINQNINNE